MQPQGGKIRNLVHHEGLFETNWDVLTRYIFLRLGKQDRLYHTHRIPPERRAKKTAQCLGDFSAAGLFGGVIFIAMIAGISTWASGTNFSQYGKLTCLLKVP
jgi:hypothetical protein